MCMEMLRDMYLSYFNDNFSYDEYLELIEGEDEIIEDYILEIIMQDFIRELNALGFDLNENISIDEVIESITD